MFVLGASDCVWVYTWIALDIPKLDLPTVKSSVEGLHGPRCDRRSAHVLHLAPPLGEVAPDVRWWRPSKSVFFESGKQALRNSFVPACSVDN